MNLEQMLTDELRTVADVQSAPPPPATAELFRLAGLDRARSRRTRVAATVLVAAAVVAAIVLGTRLGPPSSTPEPAHPSPSYYAPGVPYVYKGTLYVGHRPQPGHWTSAESYGDYTIAVAGDQTGAILHDGTPLDQINGPVYVARLSFDGTKAAWITSTQPDAGVVVVRDLPAARDLARIPVALAPRGQQGFGSSLEVRNDGTVFYEVNDKQWTWTPGGLPRRTDQGPPSETPNHPAGFEAVDAPVRLSPDHLWGAWATDPEGHVPQSFDGVPLAVTVQKPDDPASRFTLRLPAGADLAPVPFWDSPTVLYFQGMSPQMITCDIVERQCRPMSNP